MLLSNHYGYHLHDILGLGLLLHFRKETVELRTEEATMLSL